MTELFYPNSVPLTATGSLSLSRTLLMIKGQEFLVQLTDEPLLVKAKWLMVNIFLWRPLVRRGLPVCKRHTLREGLVTTKTLATIETRIYADVRNHYRMNGGDIPPLEDRYILEDLLETINDLHTMVATQLGEYHLSISAFELADLLLNPEVAALRKVDVSVEIQVGIKATEKKLEDTGKKLVEKLRDKSLPSNVIAPFLELGQLNEKQLSQCLVSIGYRTDVSEGIVRRPILECYADGLKSIASYATESMMAKKSVYYNKNAMPNSSYNNRKQQLLSSVIRRIYPGDCGSTVTVPFLIHDGNATNVKGNVGNVIDKNIIVDGRMVCLSRENVKSYVGKVVQFRSPLACRHTDGVCHVCGGQLTDFIPPQSVVGISSTIEYMAKVSQLVLSSKHFSSTKAIVYIIPEHLREVLVVRNNDIYIRKGIDVSRLKIGIQYRDIRHINELKPEASSREAGDVEHSPETVISEQQFSTIRSLMFADADTDDILRSEVSMIHEGIVPYLSTEMLSFIEDNFKNVTVTEDMVWISLKRFDHVNEPLLRCVVQSNSMIRFTEILSRFATGDIKNYTSLGDALRDFSEMVYQEVQTNIFHLETVLKSYLITNDVNYDIPIVTDPENVKFGTLLSIMPRRSLGGMFSYERLSEFMEKEPELYLLPHKHGLFDTFFWI